jgi:hypothetical protein
MSNKTLMTLEQLKEWRAVVNRNGTQEAYIDLVLQWAEACNDAYAEQAEYVKKLEAEVSDLKQHHIYE